MPEELRKVAPPTKPPEGKKDFTLSFVIFIGIGVFFGFYPAVAYGIAYPTLLYRESVTRSCRDLSEMTKERVRNLVSYLSAPKMLSVSNQPS